MQRQLALPQLYPLRQQLVLLVNLFSEFTDVFYTFWGIMPIEVLHLMQDTVDEGHDAHGQRHLGTLLQVATLVLLHTQTGLSHLLVLLFQLVVERAVLFLLLVQVVKEPQQEQQ